MAGMIGENSFMEKKINHAKNERESEVEKRAVKTIIAPFPTLEFGRSQFPNGVVLVIPRSWRTK
ncbi:hypothetical protein [Arcanobacterium ihumii]|uniref:hypothetical protein n=1 Tax=Arcanobacterium ihumii TaxID=2138162 RepID=UPI000F530026|nr:hypothetical protein [Arcanobacterium ihumii]